jgi:hypothetical protein
MSKSNPKLAGDPLRANLAEAISARDEAQRAAEDARGAVARARAMVAQAEARLVSAAATTASAKEAWAERMTTAAATGVAPPPDRGTRDARLGEVDAQDDLDAARSALATCEAAVGGPEYLVGKAEERAAAAADAVLVGPGAVTVAKLLAEAQVVQDDLVNRRVVLRFFLREKIIAPGPEADAVASFLLSVERSIPGPPPWGKIGAVDFQNWDKHPAADPWRAARAALLRSADAVLPE